MKNRNIFALGVTYLVIALWSISIPAASSNWPPPGLDVAQAAQTKHSDALLGIEGVVGHGISVDSSGQAVIVVFTEKPTVPHIPKTLDGIPVTSQFTGTFYALPPPLCGGPPSERPPECFDEPEPGIDPTARFDRPVPIGVSTGHPNITAGTIGARVKDSSGKLFVLSNNHVLADSNNAAIGDDILQPGAYDGGSIPDDIYASLYAFTPIDFSGADNTMDAAIAESDNTLLGNATPSDGYGIPANQTTPPAAGQSVQKYGRTTGLTQGTIDSLHATVSVCYEGYPVCTLAATFVEQIIIVDGSFSEGGDSGSLVVTSNTNQPVALLFAGSSSHTIATPIDIVLNEFSVTVDGEDVSVPPGGDFTLSTRGYKVKGRQKAELTWSGTNATNVDVWRDGATISTTENDGDYTDHINSVGGGSYTYQVCESGTDICSNESVVTF